MKQPLENLVPLLLDNLTPEQQLYFMLGYEFNSIIATILDESVVATSCPIHIENIFRVAEFARKQNRKVTFTATVFDGVVNCNLTK